MSSDDYSGLRSVASKARAANSVGSSYTELLIPRF